MTTTHAHPMALEPTYVVNNVVPAAASPAALDSRPSVVKLSVPLDGPSVAGSTPRRTIIRRDSLERREALLKGKEGSRQRRRWENAHLLSNPWAVEPLPQDFEIRPTYPVRSVPYYLAPLWDAAEFQRTIEAKLSNKNKRKRKHRHQQVDGGGRSPMSPAEETASNVPKEVRAKLKRARAAKGLLQDLEEQVRVFLTKWTERQRMREREGLGDVSRPVTPKSPTVAREGFELVHRPRKERVQAGRARAESAVLSGSDSDDEIVFIGRTSGADADDAAVMLDSPGRVNREALAGWEGLTRDKLVYEGLETDKGAGFARWLVHSIGAYYGLKTWSVTDDGMPAMRSAFVSVDRRGWGCGRIAGDDDSAIELPRPLWGLV